MGGHHPAPTSEPDRESAASTPGADSHNHDEYGGPAFQPRLRFMCSFGGRILPRRHDNQLRYVGGDTRIVAFDRHTSFSLLLSKLSKLSGATDVSIKYQLPNEDLDALITVTCDEDVENMMEEYDRAVLSHKSARLRLFLFPTDNSVRRVSNIDSILDGSSKHQNWFIDALNCGGTGASGLERGRWKVSSIFSEAPDYLLGLDNPDDVSKEISDKIESKSIADDVSDSDPGPPAPITSSPSCSTSPGLPPPGLPVIPDLLPVKTRPKNSVPPEYNSESVGKPISHSTAFAGAPVYHYQSQAMYFVVPGGSTTVEALPVQPQFLQSLNPVVQGQVPVGAVYATDNPLYHAARNAAVAPGSYRSMVEIPISGSDSFLGRISRGS